MPPRKKSKMVGVAEAGAAYDVVAPRGVSVRVAKDQLSGLLERAAHGEEIVITSDGVPKAVLVRYRPRLQSKPFTPDTNWLRAMPLLADSTSEIRAERDSQP